MVAGRRIVEALVLLFAIWALKNGILKGNAGAGEREDAKEYGDHALQHERPPVSGKTRWDEHRPPFLFM